MRPYTEEECISEVAEGVDPFGKKPGPAGSAVAQRQSNGRDTAMDLKDMA